MAALPSRNEIVGLTERTQRNLIFIETAYKNSPNEAVHVITQLTLSLLGILVFPYEQLSELRGPIFSKALTEAEDEGWLGWQITMDNEKHKNCNPRLTRTIADLVRHLRNAIAHAAVTFGTDSRNASEVILTFEDGPPRGKVNWRATINGHDLRRFCIEFLVLVDGAIS